MGINVNDLVETVDDLRFCEFDHSEPDPLGYSEEYKNGFNEACSKVVEILYSLSTEPVEVPEFVSEWINHIRSLNWDISYLYVPEVIDNPVSKGVKQWLDNENNCELTARAWLNGYTVAKEPEYVVVIDGLYLGEPLNDISNYVEMTWHLEYAYKFKSRNEAKEHTSILGGNVVPVEEEE